MGRAFMYISITLAVLALVLYQVFDTSCWTKPPPWLYNYDHIVTKGVPIEPVPISGSTFLKKYFYTGTPVLIRGMLKAEEVPAMRKWSPSYIASVWPKQLHITVAMTEVETKESKYRSMSMSTLAKWIDKHGNDKKFLERVRKKRGGLPYWNEADVRCNKLPSQEACLQGKKNGWAEDESEEDEGEDDEEDEDYEDEEETKLSLRSRCGVAQICRDMNNFPFVRSMAVGDWVDTRMWMGPAMARTGLHYDVDPISILHQIQGTKRVLLYQPTDLPYLYPSTKFERGGGTGQVDVFSPDLERYPLYTRARPIEIFLQPGEALYIPNGWPHAVESLNATISIGVRAWTACTSLVYMFKHAFFSELHFAGLYRSQRDCTCHDPKAPDSLAHPRWSWPAFAGVLGKFVHKLWRLDLTDR